MNSTPTSSTACSPFIKPTRGPGSRKSGKEGQRRSKMRIRMRKMIKSMSKSRTTKPRPTLSHSRTPTHLHNLNPPLNLAPLARYHIHICPPLRSPAMSLTRRQFGQDTLAALVTYSLLDMLVARDAFGNETKALAGKWLKDLNELSQD